MDQDLLYGLCGVGSPYIELLLANTNFLIPTALAAVSIFLVPVIVIKVFIWVYKTFWYSTVLPLNE